MADVRALPGLRYDPELVGDVSACLAPPWDVIPEDDLPDYAARSPYNVTLLTRPGTDYGGAGRRLRDWKDQGVLRRDGPAMYLLETEYEGRRRRDLIAALRLQPFSDGVVLPHELTHKGAKADRLEVFRATAASLEPLWFLYSGAGTHLQALLSEAFGSPPTQTFVSDDGHHLRFWVVADEGWQAAVRAAFSGLPVLIADGHHRYSTALEYADEAGGPARASSRFTLALLTDLKDPGLRVLPTHRVLRAGVPVTGGEPVGSLQEMQSALRGRVAAGSYGRGSFQIHPLEGELALVEVHRQVIDNLLGGRTAEEGLIYTRDAEEAVRWVDDGRAVSAFFLDAPDLGVVLKLAQAGKTLPQKSTYFYPKPPSGLVFLELDSHREL